MNIRNEVIETLEPDEYPDPRDFITDPDVFSVYIAGPMTGQPQFNYPAFDALADTLRGMYGFNVVSPAELDDLQTREAALSSKDGRPGSGALNGETWGDFLARDVKVIADVVDAVVLMPGWEQSKGARLEAFVARHTGKPVFYSLVYTPEHHARTCCCEEIWWPTGRIPPLVELDDAELDRVIALSDALTLLKIQQDELLAEFDTSKPVGGSGRLAAPVDANNVVKAPAEQGVGEVRITDPDTGGQKGSKIVRMDLVPAEVRRQDGLVYGAGAQKYADDNWRRGYDWRLSLSALFRHVNAWEQGEDWDEELTELAGEPVSHLAAARWHLATLFTFQQEGLGRCTLPERDEFVGFPE